MMKKLLCAVLALVLVFCTCAMAEEDLQAKLDEANAKIADLEALVAKYEPFYNAQLAATFGDDGVVWVDEVMALYEQTDAQYKSYFGAGLADMGLADFAKQQLLDNQLTANVMRMKAEELGIIDLGEEAMAEYRANAEESYNSNLETYAQYMNQGAEEITDEMYASARAYLAQNGVTVDSILDQMISDKVASAVYDYATKDVAIDDSDVQTAYEGMIADDKNSFADPSSFYDALSNGQTIAYTPEGYRYVKHALVLFDDDQAAQLKEMKDQITALEEEKAALENPEEAEATDAAETAEATEAPEETAAPRTVEEIDAEIAAINADIDTLYALLTPKAQEIIDKYNAGASFEDLIAEYNEDPGMQSGAFAQTGYPICEGSTVMVPEFTAAALALEKIGDISAPVNTDYGVHVLYYASDMPSGETDLEAIREAVEATALEDKKTAADNALIQEWIESVNPVYYYENLGIATTSEEAAAEE